MTRHLLPVFAAAPAYLTGASEEIFATGLSLPSGSALTNEQIDRISSAVADFLDRVAR